MSKRRGFSFVEVLFAIFLVGVAASIVAASMPIATVSRERADLMSKATGLAQKQLESIRGMGYANATATQLAGAGLIDSTATVATNTYSFTNSDSANLDNPARILPAGTGRVSIEQVGLDLRRIIVTVGWTERGRPRNVTVGTLVANL